MRKTEYGARDFYDVWLPELAPSAELLTRARRQESTAAQWRQFASRYRREMNEPVARHLIETLAALSHSADFSVGCYCGDESRCHRSLLRELLENAGASVI